MDSCKYETTLTEKNFKDGKIDIPINFIEVFKIKFAYAAILEINGVEHKIYITDKKNGRYEMRSNGKLLDGFKAGDILSIKITPSDPIYIADSPYSHDNPIRHIDSIEYVAQPTCYLCGQACVAMLAARPVDEVVRIINNDKGTNVEHIKAALDYYGIRHGNARVKYKSYEELPDICIVDLKLPTYNHWVLHFRGRIYDPEFGEMDSFVKEATPLRYLEIPM